MRRHRFSPFVLVLSSAAGAASAQDPIFDQSRQVDLRFLCLRQEPTRSRDRILHAGIFGKGIHARARNGPGNIHYNWFFGWRRPQNHGLTARTT